MHVYPVAVQSLCLHVLKSKMNMLQHSMMGLQNQLIQCLKTVHVGTHHQRRAACPCTLPEEASAQPFR